MGHPIVAITGASGVCYGGANRISASCLWEISRVLDAPIASFFEGLAAAGSRRDGKATVAEAKILSRPEIVPFVKAYYRIRDARLRTAISGLVKAIARSRR